MISKNKLKLINSLAQKRYRVKNKLFLAEGNNLVKDILKSEFEVKVLIGTEIFLESVEGYSSGIAEVIVAQQTEINKASLLSTPQQSIALCTIPDRDSAPPTVINGLNLCLDGIQDPGNLGTIVRIADWFGIKTIYASKNTADIYNPKAVQATMGAITRVNIFYLELIDLFKGAIEQGIPVYGSFMSGQNIYNSRLKSNGLIVMGNEGNGISSSLTPYMKHKIHIPGLFNDEGNPPDSLNVSMATAIICSEFRREQLKSKD